MDDLDRCILAGKPARLTRGFSAFELTASKATK
jgi:hypothetical protein